MLHNAAARVNGAVEEVIGAKTYHDELVFDLDMQFRRTNCNYLP